MFQKKIYRDSHHPGKPILDVQGLDLKYNSNLALQDIHFHLTAGQRVAVVGPNGAGKSSLFKIIAGVLQPTSGRVDIFGEGPGDHICIAYVPQRSQVDWNFPVNVRDVVMMGRIGRLGFLHQPGPKDRAMVMQCLEVVDMAELASRQINELSGGQQQRMFIARALAQEAELMLMDEPLSGLDLASQDSIFHILDELKNRQVTVMVAIHDLNLAAERFDQILLLNHRLMGFGQPAEVLTPENLRQAYGARLHLVDTDQGVLVLGDTCCDDEG